MLVCTPPDWGRGSTLRGSESLCSQIPDTEINPISNDDLKKKTKKKTKQIYNERNLLLDVVRIEIYEPSWTTPAGEGRCSVRLGELCALPGALRMAAPPSQEATLRMEPERLCTGLPCLSET